MKIGLSHAGLPRSRTYTARDIEWQLLSTVVTATRFGLATYFGVPIP